ncbi:MAG: cache domain-containing protein [Deltaproteobacteria bacterium]|nr:cache domain-containing protein [Deltaproteobacteria bacterium]
MPRKTSGITQRFLVNMILLTLVSLGLWGLIWIHDEYAAFKTESKSLRETFLEDRRILIRDQVAGVVDYIRYMMNQTETRLKATIESRVEEAHQIAMNIYSENRAFRTPAEIQKMIKDALRPVRFNNGRGYYFAVNVNGVSELFADRPEMEGLNLLTVTGARGELVVRDMLDLVNINERGFYQYTWTKPGDAGRDFSKIAFVRAFQPYDWVIGTGEYLDDVAREIQDEVINRVVAMQFEPSGYFFASTVQADPLFSNGKITRGTGNLWDLSDPNGVKISQEQIAVVTGSGEGFVSYAWRKLDSETPTPKLAYVRGIPEWGWIIGSGVYLDDIDRDIAQKRDVLKAGLRAKVYKSIAILLVLVTLILCWSRLFSNRIRSGMRAFNFFFEQAATRSVAIEPDQLVFAEFQEIARVANQLVSGHHQIETALQESNDKFRVLAESTPTAIMLYQYDKWVYANPAAEVICGYSAEELRSLNFWDIVHPDHREMIRARGQQRQQGQAVIQRYEFKIIAKDGTAKWVDLSGASTLLGGSPAGVISVIDITDRKHAEEKLRESNEKYIELFELGMEAIFLIDNRTGRLLEANNAATKMYGYSREELLNMRDEDLSSEPALTNQVTQHSPQGERVIPLRFHRRKDGTIFPVEIDGRFFTWRGQGVHVAAIRDITDRKKAEEERLELERQLLHAQKLESLGVLAGGIAHDFNNLLMAVLGNLELALDDLSPVSLARSSIDQAVNAAKRASELTRQMLAYSGKGQFVVRDVNLSELVTENAHMLRAAISRNVTMNLDMEENLSLTSVDPGQMQQIIMNLITNASEAIGGQAGVITIATGVQDCDDAALSRSRVEEKPGAGRFVWLEVSDTGCGMDSETQQRLFDPFFTTKFTGRGLGMSAVLGIVRGHHGALLLDSKPEKGTSIRVLLPVSPIVRAGKESSDLMSDPGSAREASGTVLIVDDDEMVCNLCEAMITRAGFKTLTAVDGVHAIEIFRDHVDEINCVLLDLTMPRMDGVAAFSELRRIRPDVRVILSSGFSEQEATERFIGHGLSGFIQKPYQMNELIAVLNRAIGQKHMSVRNYHPEQLKAL